MSANTEQGEVRPTADDADRGARVRSHIRRVLRRLAERLQAREDAHRG